MYRKHPMDQQKCHRQAPWNSILGTPMTCAWCLRPDTWGEKPRPLEWLGSGSWLGWDLQVKLRSGNSENPGCPNILIPIYLSNLSINQSIYQSVNLSIWSIWSLWSYYRLVYQSIYQTTNLSIYQSINLSIYQSINQSIYLSIYLSIHPSIYLLYLSIQLSI